jgi:hypothetical protein
LWRILTGILIFRPIRPTSPTSDILAISAADPGCLYRIRIFSYPGSRIRLKEFKYFNPKKWFLSTQKYDPGFSSQIQILIFYPSRILDPGVKKAPDPRIRNTASNLLAATL